MVTFKRSADAEVRVQLEETDRMGSDQDSIDGKSGDGSSDDGDDVVRMSSGDVHGQVLKAVTNTVKAGLTHPQLGRRLQRQLSNMLASTAPPTAMTTNGKEQEPLIIKDGGYNSRSDSGSSVPEN